MTILLTDNAYPWIWRMGEPHPWRTMESLSNQQPHKTPPAAFDPGVIQGSVETAEIVTHVESRPRSAHQR